MLIVVLSKAILVLGHFRSGTSLVARIINDLGAYIENDLFKPDENNQEGYWESKELRDINKRVLRLVGAGEFEPPAIHSGWERNKILDPLHLQAERFIERMNHHDFWVCKHPATTLTLPFWLMHLPAERYFVISIRNPLSVTSSMRSWGFDDLTSSHLWESYNLSAIVNTLNEKRLFIFYDDFIYDSNSISKQIANFLIVDDVSPTGKSYSSALTAWWVNAEELFISQEIHWGSKILYFLLTESKSNPIVIEKLSQQIASSGNLGTLQVWPNDLSQSKYLYRQLKEARAQYASLASHPFVKFGLNIKRYLRI